MEKVIIPLDLFYKMIDAIDDGDLRQQAYDAKVNLSEVAIGWISEALKDDAVRFPRSADYLQSLAAEIEK